MKAREAYRDFIERVKQNYIGERVKDGVFGAMMDVQLINDVSQSHVLDSLLNCNFMFVQSLGVCQVQKRAAQLLVCCSYNSLHKREHLQCLKASYTVISG